VRGACVGSVAGPGRGPAERPEFEAAGPQARYEQAHCLRGMTAIGVRIHVVPIVNHHDVSIGLTVGLFSAGTVHCVRAVIDRLAKS
jgi:hypothetical protein